jgi:DNA-binding transcriptional MocR family regulator
MRVSSAAELVREIESAVAQGQLAPGQSLPSVRQLAARLELSPATVSSALSELRRRGVVLTEQRRGTRIGPAPALGSITSVPVPAGARDLASGNPDPRLLPDLSRALGRLAVPSRLYGEPASMPELLVLAREQLRAEDLPADHVCVVSGALDGIQRVLAAHLRPGDRVAVENPGYAALFHLLRAHGLTPQPVAIDERGMLPDRLQEALRHGCRAVVITPRGQNPTGAALDEQRALQLRDVLRGAPQTLLVEDDHLGELAGTELHSLAAVTGSWATARSVAKALGPDLRLAILAGDRETIARVEGIQACGPGWVSHILQRLVAALSSDPEVRSLIARARETYTERREQLLDRLAAHGIQASGRSGLNVWIAVAEEASTLAALLARGWVVAPGASYRLGDSQPAIRVTISTLSRQEAERFSSALAKILTDSGPGRTG